MAWVSHAAWDPDC